MAFGPGGGSPDEIKGDINVTPLVDVCLVLLISNEFFYPH